MRNILFRGKRLDNGEWVEGWYQPEIKCSDGHLYGVSLCYKAPDGYLEDVEVIPETIGQFTGLCDKNGKKIFEGDIVVFDSGMFGVEFMESRMGFCFSGLHGRGCVPGFTMAYWEQVEVIGNIHDNPELLEVDE